MSIASAAKDYICHPYTTLFTSSVASISRCSCWSIPSLILIYFLYIIEFVLVLAVEQ